MEEVFWLRWKTMQTKHNIYINAWVSNNAEFKQISKRI